MFKKKSNNSNKKIDNVTSKKQIKGPDQSKEVDDGVENPRATQKIETLLPMPAKS